MLNAVVENNFMKAREVAQHVDNYLSLINRNSEELAKVID